MSENVWLAERFEEHRAHLRAVAYRMLGSFADADDAVQDAWLRLNRSDTSEVENLRAWLTTVTARVCLNMLRSRNARREDSLEVRVPDPVLSSKVPGVGGVRGVRGVLAVLGSEPGEEAVLADSVGLALLVVLDMLTPAERLAFVLHDMFELPFEEIAPMVGRTPAAARQLASRARRRVKGAGIPEPDPDLGRQREVVDAFFAAAREGDFGGLVAVLHPDAVLRIDAGAGAARPGDSMTRHGADSVARQALTGLTSALRVARIQHALVNGAAGVIITVRGRPYTVMGFTISDGKIVEIDAIADLDRVQAITASML